MIRAYAAITLLCVCHSAIGLIVPMPAQTLSSQMQLADAVVRGKVLRFEQIVSACPGPGKSFCLRVTVKVSELVTGPESDTIEIYETYNEPYFPDWVRNPNDQLFFLTRSRQQWQTAAPKEAEWFAALWPIPLMNLDASSAVVTDDLRFLTTCDQVMREARQAATAVWLRKRPVTIRVPDQIARRLHPQNWEVDIAPTEQAIAAARQWIKSSDPCMQWCGAEVLIVQQSPENAAALKTFAWSMKESRYDYGAEARGRLLQVLQKWGVTDLPPLVIPQPLFNAYHLAAWMSLMGWILLTVMCAVLSRPRKLNFRTFLWAMAISGIVVLGVRSFWPQDAPTFGNWDLAIERGNVYVEHQNRATQGFPSPMLICEPAELLRYQRDWFIPMDSSTHFDMSGGLAKGWERSGEIRFPGEEYADSFAEKFWPTKSEWTPNPYPKAVPLKARFSGPVWQIPLWLVLILLLIPLWVTLFKMLKRKAGAGPRGFPVTITPR